MMSDLTELFEDVKEPIRIPRGRRTPDSVLVPMLTGMQRGSEHRKQIVLDGSANLGERLAFLSLDLIPESENTSSWGPGEFAAWQSKRLQREVYRASKQAGLSTRFRAATLANGNILAQFWVKESEDGKA